MVDTIDLFKNLCYGAKFDQKRFGDDAARFKLHKKTELDSKSSQERENLEEALDFFGQNTVKEDDAVENEANKKTEKKRKNEKRATKSEGSANSVPEDYSDPAISKEQQLQRHIEQISLLRKANKIHVKGSDLLDPFESFCDLKQRFGVHRQLIKNMTSSGFTNPTPIQMQAIPLMIAGRELLACAPTGSGKTLAFIVPILHLLKGPKKKGFRAVIVSPTRELSQQIYRELCRMNEGIGLKIHSLTKAKAASNSFGSSSSQRFDILVTTPNRLVHLLNQGSTAIELKNVEILVLDEGDKLFEEGKTGFREQVAAIYQACDHPRIKRALFSATAANNIEQWCSLHLDNPVSITVGARNSAATLVEQELIFVGQESGKLLGVRNIIQQGLHPPVLVFVQSKERAKELFNELIYDGINVDVIHSDRTQAQRDNVVKSFRTGKIWILIATELMGRGIDFKGVNLVVNYDFPPSAVSYIHRIGRTGRAGREGKAITFFTEDDIENLRSIANVMKASGCEIAPWMLQIKKKNRRSLKKLEKAPPERDTIKTISKYDISKNKRKREMVDASLKRKKKKESNT